MDLPSGLELPTTLKLAKNLVNITKNLANIAKLYFNSRKLQAG